MGFREKTVRSSRKVRSKLTVLCSAEMNSACAYYSMLVSLRSTIIDGVSGKNSSFLAESALETHCFVLGGNEFRLRV